MAAAIGTIFPRQQASSSSSSSTVEDRLLAILSLTKGEEEEEDNNENSLISVFLLRAAYLRQFATYQFHQGAQRCYFWEASEEAILPQEDLFALQEYVGYALGVANQVKHKSAHYQQVFDLLYEIANTNRHSDKEELVWVLLPNNSYQSIPIPATTMVPPLQEPFMGCMRIDSGPLHHIRSLLRKALVLCLQQQQSRKTIDWSVLHNNVQTILSDNNQQQKKKKKQNPKQKKSFSFSSSSSCSLCNTLMVSISGTAEERMHEMAICSNGHCFLRCKLHKEEWLNVGKMPSLNTILSPPSAAEQEEWFKGLCFKESCLQQKIDQQLSQQQQQHS